MNQDHIVGAAVTGAPSATVLLANILQHFQGIDATTAGSEAALLILALGALAGIAQTLLAKKPGAPPISIPTVWLPSNPPPAPEPAAATSPALPPRAAS
ncbi:MAG: hypothetical protein ACREFK_15175 [Stellaceae bacterium]